MRLNSKGQVTIPASLRAQHGLQEGDEVDVVDDNGALRIVRVEGTATRGERLIQHMRGRGTAPGTSDLTTDDLMELLRGE